MAMKKIEGPPEAAPTFTKEQLLSSKRYREQRDLLTVLLEDNQTYTLDQADKLVQAYQKGKVN